MVVVLYRDFFSEDGTSAKDTYYFKPSPEVSVGRGTLAARFREDCLPEAERPIRNFNCVPKQIGYDYR